MQVEMAFFVRQAHIISPGRVPFVLYGVAGRQHACMRVHILGTFRLHSRLVQELKFSHERHAHEEGHGVMHSA